MEINALCFFKNNGLIIDNCRGFTPFSFLLLLSFPYFSHFNPAAYFVDQHSLLKLGRNGKVVGFFPC